MTTKSMCRAAASLLTVLFLAGCTEGVKEETAELVPVAGKVTMDGQPLANASIQFVPPEGSETKAAYFGSTDAEGKFTLMSPRGREGAEVGSYTVVFTKFAQADGTPLPPDLDSGDVAALGVEHMPPKYSDATVSEVRAEVPQGGKTDFEFPLTSN